MKDIYYITANLSENNGCNSCDYVYDPAVFDRYYGSEAEARQAMAGQDKGDSGDGVVLQWDVVCMPGRNISIVDEDGSIQLDLGGGNYTGCGHRLQPANEAARIVEDGNE